MEQKLTHWIDKKFKEKMLNGVFEIDKCKHGFKETIGFKPVGFWLSVNDSWEDWIKYSWESWIKGKICLRAYLDKNINLFIIESKEQFLKEFKELIGKDYNKLRITKKFMLSDFHKELKEKYDGVWLKSEPFYRHRLEEDFPYFYAWDCESICVWNKNKIKFKLK